MVEALHVEAEVLRARRARGAARDPGALVRREELFAARTALSLDASPAACDSSMARRSLILLMKTRTDARSRVTRSRLSKLVKMPPEPVLRVAASELKISSRRCSVGFYLVRRARSSNSYKPKKQAREAWTAFGVRSCTRTQEMPQDEAGEIACIRHIREGRTGLGTLRAAPLTPSERAIAAYARSKE